MQVDPPELESDRRRCQTNFQPSSVQGNLSHYLLSLSHLNQFPVRFSSPSDWLCNRFSSPIPGFLQAAMMFRSLLESADRLSPAKSITSFLSCYAISWSSLKCSSFAHVLPPAAGGQTIFSGSVAVWFRRGTAVSGGVSKQLIALSSAFEY